MMFFVVLAHDMLLGDQIKQGKQKYPDNINQVPVKTCIFKEGKIIMGYFVLDDIIKDDYDKYQPDDNMQGMKPRHKEIQAEKEHFPLSQFLQRF
jgi:hypothetical protein